MSDDKLLKAITFTEDTTPFQQGSRVIKASQLPKTPREVLPVFEVVVGEQTKAAPLLEDVPAWVLRNKGSLLKFLAFCKTLRTAVGCAATQLRVYPGAFRVEEPRRLTERFFGIRVSQRDPWNIWINPQITCRYGETVECREGCLTWPGRDILAQRHLRVASTHWTLEGELVERESTGWEAQIIQHEIDHLDGVSESVVARAKSYVRQDVRVGRNDPCPCGSGRKFKKCCGG